MKALRSVALAALAVALVAPQSSAQRQERLRFVSGGSVTAFGVHVGPYQGRILSDPTTPVIDIFCVDFTHGISNGQEWNTNWSLLSGDLSQTRQAQYFGQDVARIKYQQAAWLAMQFRLQPHPTTQWGVIHAAMWHLFTPTQPGVTPFTLTSQQWQQSNWWLAEAQRVENYSRVDLSMVNVVTDVRTATDRNAGVQEYITFVTPEPAVVILLGTGLAATFGFAALRRRAV